jgi:hypothetical protein
LGRSLDDSSHVGNLEHALVVIFHDVFFVGVLPVNSVGDVAVVVALRVRVQVVSDALVHVELCFFSVVVRGENLGEGVSHLEFAVEGAVEHGTLGVDRAVFDCALGGGRLAVVFVVVGEAQGSLLGGHLPLETLLLRGLHVNWHYRFTSTAILRRGHRNVTRSTRFIQHCSGHLIGSRDVTG